MHGNVVPRFHQVEQFVDDYDIELGGSATIFSSQFGKLGGKVFIIGVVGKDGFGEIVLERLHTLNIDTSAVTIRPDLKTGLGLALIQDDDRAILTYSGSIDAVKPSDLSNDILNTCRHWHIASIFLLKGLRDHWKSLLQYCRSHNITTSIDPNWDPEEKWEGFLALLPMIDVYLSNAAEAKAISGENDVINAGNILSSHGNIVVIKMGEKGAIAFHKGQVWQVTPEDFSQENIQVVDTIGAGDSFDAGFIRAWQLGRDIQECLNLAMRCGAANVTGRGGFERQLKDVVI